MKRIILCFILFSSSSYAFAQSENYKTIKDFCIRTFCRRISDYPCRTRQGMKETQPSINKFALLFHVRADAPPLVIISGDREMEMLGRYKENAYFWRMMKVVGHKETYLYELDGYDHGAMASQAFHILKDHVKRLLESPQQPYPSRLYENNSDHIFCH